MQQRLTGRIAVLFFFLGGGGLCLGGPLQNTDSGFYCILLTPPNPPCGSQKVEARHDSQHSLSVEFAGAMFAVHGDGRADDGHDEDDADDGADDAARGGAFFGKAGA